MEFFTQSIYTSGIQNNFKTVAECIFWVLLEVVMEIFQVYKKMDSNWRFCKYKTVSFKILFCYRSYVADQKCVPIMLFTDSFFLWYSLNQISWCFMSTFTLSHVSQGKDNLIILNNFLKCSVSQARRWINFYIIIVGIESSIIEQEWGSMNRKRKNSAFTTVIIQQ